MSVTRFLDWFQLAGLAFLVCLAVPRMVRLYARGIHVLAIDRQRTPGQMLEDLLAGISLVLWWYELVAYAWPLSLHLVPARLGRVLFDAVVLKVTGAALMAAGLVIYGLALTVFRDSWRLGIDRKTPGPLVTGGIFTWTRNPIYVGFDLMIVGTLLIQGRLIFLVLAVVFVGMLHLLILREERFLSEKYGDAYQNYRARVGRYITWPSTRSRA
ncbi:MAG: isoprenylcysteine carboxylmethyltransferase family protein [Phycisphaerales bacterium]|nr:MAG: isoprenylcysteine carboxylmethyltransferase family protein [Phycisphaerales bacterium]